MIPPLKKHRVTRWSHPDDLIETRFCRMCYKYWLGQECIRRMEKSLQDSWVEANEDGMVAMFVWLKSPVTNIQPEEETV